MDIICCKGFIGEALNIAFFACEVSILIAYLIVTSFYQVVIGGLLKSDADLLTRVTLINAKQKLKLIRIISIITAFTSLISIMAVLSKNFTVDILSIGCFTLVVICFTFLILNIINKLLSE